MVEWVNEINECAAQCHKIAFIDTAYVSHLYDFMSAVPVLRIPCLSLSIWHTTVLLALEW
jgi:hypothetical protein